MAGLYIKELMLREDVHRCLIVAPGGLVEQWQDELYLKFGLRFDIFSRNTTETAFSGSPFEENPLMIARMDQLARNEELVEELARSDWDLVVVDEAHRMGAHYFSGKLEKTKRFQLGEVLGRITRHLLLMTATPHSGKEDDFQLFLTLLDRDRFEGRSSAGPRQTDTEGIMRRMVKEDLLTFEGKPLFPDRKATTLPYELSEAERDLYEAVTSYVREGMNRAKNLDGKRRNTVGFALTVLQRRLASSPEAIHKSLVRRSERLEKWKKRLESGEGVIDPEAEWGDPYEFEDDEFSAAEREEMEEELVDAATAARTVEELDVELADLARLVEQSRRVRNLETDRKWSELRTVVEEQAITGTEDGPRKLIIFTEHRDTLEYLAQRIRSMIGRHDSVVTIHGGVRRGDRRQRTEEFTHNPDCRIMIATDAAGEGLNLQVANLMVNYDLPWNPNRIEQRFGRIHRIGQMYPCHLWNLVAVDTREGAVFIQLLAKIEEQRKAYGGKVFDVLGGAFADRPLRDLLIEAILEGEDPEVRARMERVIDEGVSDGIQDMLKERALATGTVSPAELNALRDAMDEARARRLQPHYIERAFRESFSKLGGRIVPREKATFEIKNVPVEVRQEARYPVSTKYERVTFELEQHDQRAELIAPGHSLHDAVMDLTVEKSGEVLERGTVLVSAKVDAAQLLVGLMEEITDGAGEIVDRRFSYAYVSETGEVTDAGPAPYLDCVAAPEFDGLEAIRNAEWLPEAEHDAMSWLIANRVSKNLEEVKTRRLVELERTRVQVEERLIFEQNRLVNEANVAAEKAGQGKKVRESEASLMSKATEISQRMEQRIELITRQEQRSAKPPRVVAAALVLPVEMIDPSEESAEIAPLRAKDTKAVERRGVELALKSEKELGRRPEEQPFNNPGFDILSRVEGEPPIRIEVKARIEGAKDFYVTHNEVMTGLNASPRYRLAMIRVSQDGPEKDEIRYLDNPFEGYSSGDFASTATTGDWDKMWAKGKPPF
jgi:superfamily II DNA or RNA helicase